MVIIGGTIYFWKKEFFGSGTPVRTTAKTETRTVVTKKNPQTPTIEEVEVSEVKVTTSREETQFHKDWKSDGVSNGYEWFSPVNPDKATTEWISVKGYEYAFRHFSPCIKDLKINDGTVKSFKVDPEKKEMRLVVSESPFKVSEECYSKTDLEKIGHSSTDFRLRPYDDKPIDVIIGRRR